MAGKKRKSKYEVGAIVAVPLPDGRFAYAKVFKDLDLGVYDFLSAKIEPLASVIKHRIAFFQACTDAPIKSGAWPVIGVEPFPDEESAWGPPRAVGVRPGGAIDPRLLQITHKGVQRRAKPQEVVGLDIEMFCQRPELFTKIVVDRLVNGDHSQYRVKA